MENIARLSERTHIMYMILIIYHTICSLQEENRYTSNANIFFKGNGGQKAKKATTLRQGKNVVFFLRVHTLPMQFDLVDDREKPRFVKKHLQGGLKKSPTYFSFFAIGF